jgi:hypothetical protein
MRPDSEGGCTRILIVANRTAAAQRLLDAVERRAASGPCTFTLLVPDVEHHRDANWTLETGQRLLSKAAGTAVAGLAGGPDPLVAVQEAVATGSYDEIIISTLPRGVSKWLRRDLVRRVQRLGLPVIAIVPGDRPRRSLDDFAMDSIDLNRQAFHTASRGTGPESQHRRGD